jgi:small subunit ribosomal protein S17
MADEQTPNTEEEVTEEPVAETPPEEPAGEETSPEAPAADAPTSEAETPAEEPAAEETSPEAPAAAAPTAEAEAPAEAEPKKKRKRLPRSQRHKHSKPVRERPAERKPLTRTPQPESDRGRRQERRGVVVSSAMDKTIVVRVESIKAHQRYKKVVRRSVKFHAHDEQNVANVGDVVRIVETRPISKSKHWRLVEVVEAAR